MKNMPLFGMTERLESVGQGQPKKEEQIQRFPRKQPTIEYEKLLVVLQQHLLAVEVGLGLA